MTTENFKNWTYQCPECHGEFEKPVSFRKHLEKEYSIKISVCHNCPLFFTKLSELFLHSRQIHNNEKRKNKKPCKFQCQFEECMYQTDNGGLMKHHVRSHTNNKPYMCEICNKTFTQKSNMKTHFNRHKKNQFLFECHSCEKSFNSHTIFLSHLETREHLLGQLQSQKR